MSRFHRILVGTDLTRASDLAVKEAVEVAREAGAELVILHVYTPPNVTQADCVAAGVYEEWDQNLRAEIVKKLEPLVEAARRRLVSARALVLPGIPWQAIAKAAEENGAGLVVLGTRGRSAFSRLWRPSTTARVISKAPCPVMTVPAALPGRRSLRPEGSVREWRASPRSRSG